MRTALAPANLRIGLIHHPTDCFQPRRPPDDRARSKAVRFLAARPHPRPRPSPHAEGIRICAGATAADSAAESATPSCFDTASGKGNALLFDYDKRARPVEALHHCQRGRTRRANTLHRLVPENASHRSDHPPHRHATNAPTCGQPAAVLTPAATRRPPAGTGNRTGPACRVHQCHAAPAGADPRLRRPRKRKLPAPACTATPHGRASVPAACSSASRPLEGTAATDLPARLRQHLDFALFNGGALSPTTSIADGLFAALQAGGPALLVLDSFETW